MPYLRRLPRRLAVVALAALPLGVLPALPAYPAYAAPAGTVAAKQGERTVSGGRLDWGFKSSFQSYVTGPIAKGSWTLNGGASTVGENQFRFHSASGGYTPSSGAFHAAFQGGVRFVGHRKSDGTYEMDLTVSRPSLRVNGGSGTLYADIRSKAKGSGRMSQRNQVPLASLNLSGVNMRGGGSPVALTGVPATLTAEGAKSFAGYYKAGTPLDPVSLSVDVTAGSGKTDGPKGSDGGKKSDGKDTKKKARKAGRIEDAAVDWGVRRTFREYVTGDIAQGRWRLTDGARNGGALFRFGRGEGKYDLDEGSLRADFAGTVRFTGKDLDLTLSKVAVRVEEGKGTLLADVRGDGGTRKKQPLVTFAATRPQLRPDDRGLVTLTEAPATLTAQGAKAFGGMYPKGTAMDPVSLAVTLNDRAELPPLPDLGSDSDDSDPSARKQTKAQDAERTEKASESSTSATPWIAGGAGALVLLAAAVTTVLVRRRRGTPSAD
ncbi:HtaA domain-containing protein [Streptomyces sp. NPDC005438]|uniref:HtaA domain-containing protein n=1 Tax=Streptomyces sp. NPDC005438 TaxID=3156880 RepID=UPI0033AEF56F